MYQGLNSTESHTGFVSSHDQPESLSNAAFDGSYSSGPSLRDSNLTAGHCSASSLQNSLELSSLDGDVLQPRPVRALRRTHARARSATASTAAPSFIIADPRRTRSASLSGNTNTSDTMLSYTYPMTLPRGIFPRAEPVLSVATEIEETIGSFSPTSCPRQQLYNILEALSPRPRRRSTLRVVTSFGKPDKAHSREQSPSSSPSPPLSPLPSICRTPSSYSESEYFSTAPSSAGPATPVHSAVSSPQIQNKALRPILEALEDSSKFRVQTACASCGKMGSNYPCCPRCGEMWCSRTCRLRSTRGKRHVCGRNTS